MRLLFITVIVAVFATLSACGTIGGAGRGLGNDVMDFVEISSGLF